MRRILALFVATAIMVAMLAMAASAQPTFSGGLVNIDIDADDVVDAQVPISVAANICANVSVLEATEAAEANETIDCEARSDAIANLGQGSQDKGKGPGQGKQ